MEAQRAELDAAIADLREQMAAPRPTSPATAPAPRRRMSPRDTTMAAYTPPLDDMAFLLHDVLDVEDQPIPGYAELDRATTAAVLEEAGKHLPRRPRAAERHRRPRGLPARERRRPHARRASARPSTLLRDGGWTGLDCDPEYGGQGMPYVLHTAAGEMQSAANMAFAMYSGLTHGAYSAIHAHGTAEQKALYLPKLVACELDRHDEPDRAACRHRPRAAAHPRRAAAPTAATASPARRSSSPPATTTSPRTSSTSSSPASPARPPACKGISLFIVPKFLVERRRLASATRNALSVGKLEEKMGIHGNATCVMDYDGATGWMLGARERRPEGDVHHDERGPRPGRHAGPRPGRRRLPARRGLRPRAPAGPRHPGPANPDGPADPLIVHPDVRRLLLDQKAFVEGARAFVLWAATLIDAHARAGDAGGRRPRLAADPGAEGLPHRQGLRSASQAQQVFGGHGYVEETGIAQFVRDSRIAMIYEGANGIQALDLVGRKLPTDGGKPIMAFFALVRGFLKANEADARLKADFLDPLKAASKDLQSAAEFFLQNLKTPDAALAGSTDFLHLFGHVCLGLMWARMAKAALAATDDFGRAKLATGRYYMARVLPATALHLARIRSGAGPVMALAAEAF